MVKDEEPDGSNLILRQLECPSDQTRDFLGLVLLKFQSDCFDRVLFQRLDVVFGNNYLVGRPKICITNSALAKLMALNYSPLKKIPRTITVFG